MVTPERWQIEQDVASRFLKDLEVGVNDHGWPQLRGLYEQLSEHGHLYGAFRLRIVYPPLFPSRNTQPRVTLENPPATWVNTLDGHVYPDWGLCLGVALDGDIDFTLADAGIRLFEVIDTFLRLERIFQQDLRRALITGIEAAWPGPQRSHGLLGMYESMQERGEPGRNQPCPCGSGDKYKNCHWSDIQNNKELLRRRYAAQQREAQRPQRG